MVGGGWGGGVGWWGGGVVGVGGVKHWRGNDKLRGSQQLNFFCSFHILGGVRHPKG